MSVRKKEIVESVRKEVGRYFRYVPEIESMLKECRLNLKTNDEDDLFIYKGYIIKAYMQHKDEKDGYYTLSFVNFFKDIAEVMDIMNFSGDFSIDDIKKTFQLFQT